MKSIAALLLAMIAYSIPAMSQTNEFVIPLSDPSKKGKLIVDINYGSISVKGSGRKDVLVKYTSAKEEKEKGKDNNQGLKRIGGGGLDLEASENNNQITVESSSWSTKVNLEIEIPTAMNLSLHTYNGGNLFVSNVAGALELENYNGEITALNISGSVIASTYNGEIKVTYDNYTDGTPMSYSTYNGDINLTFPASTKASFKMKTQSGDIYTDFDMKITSSGPVQTKDSRSGGYKLVVDEWKRGDVNGGGAEISLQNYNGSIYIRKK